MMTCNAREQMRNRSVLIPDPYKATNGYTSKANLSYQNTNTNSDINTNRFLSIDLQVIELQKNANSLHQAFVLLTVVEDILF